MDAKQHVVVSSAATLLYNSGGTTGNAMTIKNLGPSYKVMILTNSTQNTSQGYPLCKGESLGLTFSSNSPGVFAQLAGQTGANASTVFSQVAVFQTP